MKIPIKKHPTSILLAILFFIIAMEMVMHIYYGYYSSGNILFVLSMGFTAVIRYSLIIICIAVTIWSAIKRQHKMLFILSWIFLTALGQIPKWHYDNLGALLALYNANPNQVLSDTRLLADEYPPMTCFGYVNQRYPCDDPIPHDKLPASIQSSHAGNVLIMDDYILIEKFGLEGVFRGYVAFRKGFDFWENEAPFTLGDCSHCWKIRIVDGLYWYSANPSDRPIFISPLH